MAAPNARWLQRWAVVTGSGGVSATTKDLSRRLMMSLLSQKRAEKVKAAAAASHFAGAKLTNARTCTRKLLTR